MDFRPDSTTIKSMNIGSCHTCSHFPGYQETSDVCDVKLISSKNTHHKIAPKNQIELAHAHYLRIQQRRSVCF
jgi:hypothetical protein